MAGALPSCMKRGGTVSLRMIPPTYRNSKKQAYSPAKSGGNKPEMLYEPGIRIQSPQDLSFLILYCDTS